MNRLAEIHAAHNWGGDRAARYAGTKQALAKADDLRKQWATINGVVMRRQAFSLDHLARDKYPYWRDVGSQFVTWPGLDHPRWFWADHRPAMMTVEPYHDDDLPALSAHVARFALALHVPPNPYASFHYPGRTIIAAITRPGREVQWLADQLAYEVQCSWEDV